MERMGSRWDQYQKAVMPPLELIPSLSGMRTVAFSLNYVIEIYTTKIENVRTNELIAHCDSLRIANITSGGRSDKPPISLLLEGVAIDRIWRQRCLCLSYDVAAAQA
jgi:hypothetical protein